MPTGYTAQILDGATFQQYALSCARAFGALITMREDPSDAPIPDEFKPSTYHTNELRKARAEVERLRAMTPQQMKAAAERSNRMAMKAHQERVRRSNADRAKYTAVLEQAKAYKAPTKDHEAYRKFMIEQIEGSIKFDCMDKDEAAPERVTPEEWFRSAMDYAQRNVTYYTKEKAQEEIRCAERTEWIRELKKSLGIPALGGRSGAKQSPRSGTERKRATKDTGRKAAAPNK